jgi:predicted YcjX-like family ATPase
MINRTHHIGVIGLTQSGKTTFITSLLDHWTNHNPNKFSLGKRPIAVIQAIVVEQSPAFASVAECVLIDYNSYPTGGFHALRRQYDQVLILVAH